MAANMQGVVKIYDPVSKTGSLLVEPTLEEVAIATLEGSPFRFLRQGQRVNFDLDDAGRAANLRFGSEGDMQTPTERPPSV